MGLFKPENIMLAGNIRKILDEKGIKYCKIATQLGLSNAGFSKLLSGKSSIKAAQIPIIAKAIGVTPNILFNYKSE